MRDLTVLRKELNGLDEELKALLLRRMEVSHEVAAYKAETSGQVFAGEREEEILDRVTSSISGTEKSHLRQIFSDVMRASRQIQYGDLLRSGARLLELAPGKDAAEPKKVCHQGVAGAYSQLAAAALFPNSEIFSVPTFSEVFRRVEEGEYDCGVLPIDNTTAGNVGETYDLLSRHGLYITKAGQLAINHCLISRGKPEEIKTVYSHPQALEQCSEFCSKMGFRTVAVSNTAVAADMAAQGGSEIAAIASVEAAQSRALPILMRNIQDCKQNATRFVAVSRHPAPDCDGKISVAFQVENKPGSLVGVLEIFRALELDVTKIQSRPIPDSRWEYCFYADFMGNLSEERTRCALYQMKQELPLFLFFGNYLEVEL